MWTYSFPFGIINEVAMNSNASYIVVADGAGYVYYFKDRAPVRLTLLTPESPV